MPLVQVDQKVLDWLEKLEDKIPPHAFAAIQIMSDGSGAVETSDGNTIFFEDEDGTVLEMMFSNLDEIDAFVDNPATLQKAWAEEDD